MWLQITESGIEGMHLYWINVCSSDIENTTLNKWNAMSYIIDAAALWAVALFNVVGNSCNQQILSDYNSYQKPPIRNIMDKEWIFHARLLMNEINKNQWKFEILFKSSHYYDGCDFHIATVDCPMFSLVSHTCCVAGLRDETVSTALSMCIGLLVTNS